MLLPKKEGMIYPECSLGGNPNPTNQPPTGKPNKSQPIDITTNFGNNSGCLLPKKEGMIYPECSLGGKPNPTNQPPTRKPNKSQPIDITTNFGNISS